MHAMHMRAVEHTIRRGLCTHHAAWINYTENRCRTFVNEGITLLFSKLFLNRCLLMEGHSPGSAHSDIYRGTKRFGRTRLVVPSSRSHVGNQRSSISRNPPPIDIIEAHLRPSVALGILFSNSRYSCLTVDAPNTGKDQ